MLVVQGIFETIVECFMKRKEKSLKVKICIFKESRLTETAPACREQCGLQTTVRLIENSAA